MFYKDKELQKATEEVKKAMDSGVPVVGMEIFNCSKQLNINNQIINI